jgi:hypothetical protein
MGPAVLVCRTEQSFRILRATSEGLNKEPNAASPPEVSYPRAVDQFPTPEREATGRRRWVTAVQDSLGLVAVVWSIPAAILIVAIPIALVAALIIWVGRFV